MSAPPELPVVPDVAAERTMLASFLDYFRAVMLRKVWGLDHDQLHRRLEPSSLTLGALLKHLAVVEISWFEHRFAGLPLSEPWVSAPWDDDPDWEMTSAVDDTPEDLVALYVDACERSRRVFDSSESLDELAANVRDPNEPLSLRWIMIHMIEEYARHCGHADFLREAIDGSTGD